MKAGLLAALCACAFGLGASPTDAETLAVSQDSYANGIKPDDTNKTNTVLKVRSWGDNSAFLQFDVSGLAGQTVVSAGLVVEVVDIISGSGGAIEARLPQDSWSADTLTFNTQPALGTPRASVTVNEADIGNHVTMDIAGIVQGWLDGSIPNYGLALTSSVADPINLRLGSGSAEIHVQLARRQSYGSAPVQLNWRAPATRSDGTPLSVGEIDSYILLMNHSLLSESIPGDAVTATVDILSPGEYCFRLAARDLDNRIGHFSPPACWSVVPAPQG